MHRIIFLLTVVATFGTLPCISQSTTFKHEFDIPGEQTGHASHIATADGGMLVTTQTSNTVIGDHFITLIKTNVAGMIQWTKRFGPVYSDFFNVVQSPDSTYFVCLFNHASTGFYHVLKLSTTGNLIFSNRIDLPANYSLSFTPQTIAKNDGGYYIAGDFFDTLASVYHWHLFELNSTGNVLWSNSYNMNAMKTYHVDMDTCDNGDIVLLGSWYNALMLHEVVLSRIAPGGQILWTKRLAATNYDLMPLALEQIDNDYFLITGYSYNVAAGAVKILYLKTDGLGDEVWAFTYSTNMIQLVALELKSVENNNVVLIGEASTGSFCLKTDSAGLVLCARAYDSLDVKTIDSIPGQGYSMAGFHSFSRRTVLLTTDLYGIGCDDYVLPINKTPLSTTSDTLNRILPVPLVESNYSVPQAFLLIHVVQICTTVGIEEPASESSLNAYPVPASNTLRIASAEVILSVELIDINGQIIRTAAVNSASFDLDVSGLAEGVYFLRVHGENETSSRKIIIQH